MKKFLEIIALLTLFALLVACGAEQPTATQIPVDEEATQVAQNIEQTKLADQAEKTQTHATQVAAMTETAINQPTATSTATLVPATATNALPPTSTPFPSSTPRPTSTSGATGSSGSGTIYFSSACYAAYLVSDLAVENGASITAGTQFTKVWRVMNVGTCTWTKNFWIVFDSGKILSGQNAKLNQKVVPGDTIDIAVDMVAPSKEGTYTGYWLLKAGNDETFGIGYRADIPLEVTITVTSQVSSSYVYDFAAHICSATWKNDENTLYCNGTSGTSADYVQYSDNFKMETGREENESAILATISQQERIRGIYPAVQIHTGDRFVAQSGCLYGSTNCNVMMRLSYNVSGGGSGVLDEWLETYDGSITTINIDLSAFAGKEVSFTLDMEAKTDAKSHEVFWFLPSIRNP